MLHHFLEYAILLIDIPTMDEVAPSYQNNHEKDDDGDEHCDKSHAIFRTFIRASTSGILKTAIVAVIYIKT